ncbi:MAG: hypothetical protein ACREPM_13375, partial [Gemmatimonadaceae bacterium]
ILSEAKDLLSLSEAGIAPVPGSMQSCRMIPAALPPLYSRWLDDALGGSIPAETNATCDSCAMVIDGASDAPVADIGFNPKTKCCTFLPELWNFLVGAVLLDDDPAAARGRATVEARLDAGIAVTPLGLGRTTTYALLYAAGQADVFGHSERMLCPHYLNERGGLCGVWRHRESTCATWFCKYERGAVGQQFWQRLHQLLQAAEEALAAWALLELNLDGSALATVFRGRQVLRPTKLSSDDVDGVRDPLALNSAWGSWRGRERELYVKSARLVASLTWSDVQRIGGAKLGVHERVARDSYAQLLDTAPPQRPDAALVQITPRGRNRARLASYSPCDALDVPAVVAKVLPFFDGRPMADAIAEVHAREGVTIDPSLVRKLTDFGILRDAAANPR